MDAGWARLEADREGLVTSNFVLDETATLLGRRADNRFAAKRLKNIYASSVLKILRPDTEDELQAIEWFVKFADQGVSFTDCMSFTLITREGLRTVFSFDQHFDFAGFGRVPKFR